MGLNRLRERPTHHLAGSHQSPTAEAARWILEHHGFEYREAGTASEPTAMTPETRLVGVRAILEYYDARSRRDAQLYPPDTQTRGEVADVVDCCLNELAPALERWWADSTSGESQERTVETLLQRI